MTETLQRLGKVERVVMRELESISGFVDRETRERGLNPMELVRLLGIRKGSIYTTLQRLEAKGLVESRSEVDPTRSGKPRRFWRVKG